MGNGNVNISTVLVGFLLALFIFPLIGVTFGALAGFVVGLVFTDTVQVVGNLISDTPMPAWQVGAALGFVGSFFKTTAINRTQ
jgi:hypothetical protein